MMRKFFSVLFVLGFAFAYANENVPVFEETDETECKFVAKAPFSASEMVFEKDNENKQETNSSPLACTDDECDCEDGCSRLDLNEEETVSSIHAKFVPIHRLDRFEKSNCMCWKRYKVNFGMEKVFLRFPYSPTISQSSSLLTAHAHEQGVTYSFMGYYPPMGNISPAAWFDEIMFSITRYPFTCLSSVVFQVSSGDWVLDYVAHDFIQNLIIKTRAIVTPFNAYTIQCVKPNGARDHFDYFIDSFWIKCECAH